MKRLLSIGIVVLLAACATKPAPQQPSLDNARGTASWYGQEFAGRATANGEIFDPLQFTAAHRTLPFGTVIDVTNVKSGQTVRVRVNDRGPYIADRVIDLSYAAAQKIGLVEPGTGEVALTVVKWGKGDREPPAPYVVSVPEVKPMAAPQMVPASTVDTVPVVIDSVKVVEQRGGVETRRQVSADGKSIETVPVATSTIRAPQPPAAPTTRQAVMTPSGRYVVQVGAFAQENNAKLLQDQLAQLGEKAFIDHGQLSYVRLGPFASREEAVRMRARLENEGLSAIVVKQ